MATAVSTSLERTYRYLRIGVAGTVVAILLAVAQASTTYGWLTSISDYFYTPARDVFVGALVAASLALLPAITEPPMLRDFMAFEKHLVNVFPRLGREIPPEWYEHNTDVEGEDAEPDTTEATPAEPATPA